MLADHRAAAQRGEADRRRAGARRYGRRGPARCSRQDRRRARRPPPRRAAAPCRTARRPCGGGASRGSRCRSRAGRAPCAACSTSTASRLTPRLILPDLTIVAWRAAAAILASSSGRAAGRADDMDDARLRGVAGEFDGRRRHGEVEHAVGLGEGRQRIVGDRHVDRADAGDLAGILAEMRRAGALDRRRRRARRPSRGWCGSASGPCGRRRRPRPGACRSSLCPLTTCSCRGARRRSARPWCRRRGPAPCRSARRGSAHRRRADRRSAAGACLPRPAGHAPARRCGRH